MDAENALKSEIFRPIVVTLIPGSMAIAPFIFVAEHFSPSLFEQFEKHQTLCIAATLAAVIAIGLILEDLGSRLEVIFWWFMETDTDNENWFKYLATDIRNCPAKNYIQSIVMRMKFESSFGIACLIAAIGYRWLYCINMISSSAYCFVTISLCTLSFYLIFESYSGVRLLKNLRAKLLS